MRDAQEIVAMLSAFNRRAFLNYVDLSKEYEEIANLKGVQQDPVWHPEGDVFVHTFLVIRSAIIVSKKYRYGKSDSEILVLSALCHDFGKPLTTMLTEVGHVLTKNADLKWTSYGHEEAGVPVARGFLASIGADHLCPKVLPLVEHHLAHRDFSGKGHGNIRTVRRLAKKLKEGEYDATIPELINLMRADICGRPVPGEPIIVAPVESLEKIKAIYDGMAEELRPKLQPIITGKDIVPFKIRQGPAYGIILSNALDAQKRGLLTVENKEEWLKKYMLEECSSASY